MHCHTRMTQTNPVLIQTFGVFFSVMREKKTLSYQATFSSFKRLSRLCLDSISFTIDRVCQSWFNERLAVSFCKHQLHAAWISPQWKDQMSQLRCVHSWNLAHLHTDLAWTHHRRARNVFKGIWFFWSRPMAVSIFQPWQANLEWEKITSHLPCKYLAKPIHHFLDRRISLTSAFACSFT